MKRRVDKGTPSDWEYTDSAATAYQIRIRLEEDLRLKVGKLGTFYLPAGDYVYTGSARRNLASRVQRHLSDSKKLRWHIDYLLQEPSARVISVAAFAADECGLNQNTPGKVLVTGFGSSDCRSGCGSHLKYVSLPTDEADPPGVNSAYVIVFMNGST